MEIPSGLNPTPRPLTPKSQPVDVVFTNQVPKDSFPAKVKDIYLSPKEQAQSLAETLNENKEAYAELIEQAVEKGELGKQEAAQRLKNFQDGKIGPYQKREKVQDVPSTLTQLNELENEQFCLTRVPQQCADGLYRSQDYYMAPGTLALKAAAQGWEMSADSQGQELPVADVVVIGAGPGGLTSAWQTARRGGRVVCFESEIAGAAFSDAGAKAVHHMRTSADGTNLVRDGHAFATLEHPLSLPGHLSTHRNLAKRGREGQAEMTGQEIHGIPDESLSPNGRNAPATRGELFEHLAQLSHSLANDFDDAVLCERSPVNEVSFEDGLFTVSTSRGHKVKAKNIVLATGLTGVDGGRGNSLPLFQKLAKENPDQYLALHKSSDPVAQSETLAKDNSPSLIIRDRLLGDQSVRQSIAELPEGTRAAIVGSGSSAIKSALELMALHPGLSVDIFSKGYTEASQPQLPNENFHQAVLEVANGEEYSEAAAKKLKEFGSPATPRSLQHVFEAQQTGRLRLLELGEYFCEECISLTPAGDGKTTISVKSPEVAQRLEKQAKEFQAKGLLPANAQAVEGTQYGLLVESIGYSSSAKDHMLSHLPEEAQAKIHLNSAGLGTHVSHSSIPGLSTRGRQIADQLAEQIPEERRVEVTVPQDHRVDWRDTDAETAQGIIDSRGNHPGFVAAVERELRREGSHPQELQLVFPTSDRKLLTLAQTPPEQLSAAEREVLERGRSLADRMRSYKADA